MSDSANLALPYLEAAQAQKHVTHNDALTVLDALVQLSVRDRGLSVPPSTPANGHRYLVAAGPTGVWSGQAGKIASFQDGGWMFHQPREGWICWVEDEDMALVFDGASWVVLTASPGSSTTLNPATGGLVGVNTTADATNRLSVSAPAVLLNHEGAGHQLKINKSAASDTASVLFQTGFSGRAEFGLTGDDDWHVKVSADGTVWKEALVVHRSSGAVSFPFTPQREVLTAARVYYVRPDGNDTNNGLTNTQSGAFATIPRAMAAVAGLDLRAFDVTIQLADGTYTAGASVMGPWIGSGNVSLIGNTATPANCILSVPGNHCISVSSGGRLRVRGIEFRTTGGGNGINAVEGGIVTLDGPTRFGPCATYHINAAAGGRVVINADYAITGGSFYHWIATTHGGIASVSRTITVTGAPAFGVAFAYAGRLGGIDCHFNTFIGAATGQRYAADGNGVIFTNGGGANYLPGNVAGAVSSGGVYQ